MQPLLQAYDRAINSSANAYINNPNFPIHPDVIRAQFKTQFVKALDTYDPRRNVQLNTHIFNTFKKASRFFMRHQNVGIIPEVRALKIREFRETRAKVSEMLGREPNSSELAHHLKWAPQEVKRMEAELRRTSPTSEFEDEPTGMRPSKEAEVIDMIQYELVGEEKLVYEFLFGVGGKPKLSPGEIASRLGWTPSKITRLKQKIVDKMRQYL